MKNQCNVFENVYRLVYIPHITKRRDMSLINKLFVSYRKKPTIILQERHTTILLIIFYIKYTRAYMLIEIIHKYKKLLKYSKSAPVAQKKNKENLLVYSQINKIMYF